MKKIRERIDDFAFIFIFINIALIVLFFCAKVYYYSYDLKPIGGSLVKGNISLLDSIRGDDNLIFNFNKVFNFLLIFYIVLLFVELSLLLLKNKKRLFALLSINILLITFYVWSAIAFVVEYCKDDDYFGVNIPCNSYLNAMGYIVLLVLFIKIVLIIIGLVKAKKKNEE